MRHPAQRVVPPAGGTELICGFTRWPCGTLPRLRHVKGVLFADYVRMLRGHKGTDWSPFLASEDLAYLAVRITPDQWYPMDSFERMGNAILHVVAHDDLQAVRMWGKFSVDHLRTQQPMLVQPGDPVETLTRFRVLRSTYFDFDALAIPLLHEDEAQVVISYHMGRSAEEAASLQTMGFFERLLEMAGATDVRAAFASRSWLGEPQTLLKVHWQMPATAR